MTSDRLTQSYLKKAIIRIKALKFMHAEKGYSDVIREAQECVELLLKALLRKIGIEAPKSHDVGPILKQHESVLPPLIYKHLKEIIFISRSLRKDRELSFYGTEDWIPTDEYSKQDSLEAIAKVEKIFKWVSKIVIQST